MSNVSAINAVIFLLISTLFSRIEKEKVFVIIDDCQQWEKHRPIDEQYFSITTNKVCCASSYYSSYDDKDTLASVHLFNGDIDLNPPELLEIAYTELLNLGVRFSSEIGVEQWGTFNSEESELYIILPDDFCSEKRFLHSAIFTLYKTRVSIDYPGPDCVLIIDDPMRFFPKDTIRRNRSSDN
ncbi:hypothetical protein [Algoriphagus sp. NG3]|uniref:hypothetical protein n=1 Tax=Algoriphagus sp. NG3 TaxID=3097546 RepID=UPI002A827F4D|nr:hypothetical protein [Algoriphagus sp. NG3]WPR74546.1 hypothetical protein SLW71_17940 [Algoriphagus sp. NG3]